MKFTEVLPALLEGKKIRRKDIVWKDFYSFIFIKDGDIVSDNIAIDRYILDERNLKADDWEIVKETKKVKLKDLTKTQYKYFCKRDNDPNDLYRNNNPKYCDVFACNTCPCKDVICDLTFDNCRFYHKDLYSDKFLNQYVETYDEDDLPKELEDYH